MIFNHIRIIDTNIPVVILLRSILVMELSTHQNFSSNITKSYFACNIYIGGLLSLVILTESGELERVGCVYHIDISLKFEATRANVLIVYGHSVFKHILNFLCILVKNCT